MSDHSFCLRQDTTTYSKKRLKLSLNHLAPSSHGLTPEVSKDHSLAKECSPKFSASSNNNAQTDARSPYPPTSPNPSVGPGPGKSCATAKSQSKTPSLSASTTNNGCSPPKQQSNTPILSASTNNDFTEQPSTNTKPPKSDVRKPTSPQAKSLPESGLVDKQQRIGGCPGGFFKSLRDTCGDVQTEYFMSDDADAYHNAWPSIFTKPVRKLLCSWHVDRSWRRKLNELIKDKDQQVEVYAALKSLQNEPSECKFRRSLQQFLAWLKGISKPMVSYFEKEYVSRPREWATCFREGTPANTNMFVESFHRTLKEIYLERKQNRRVDHLLSTLRKISRDKAYEQWIKAEKGKATQRQRDNNKRHKQAESIPAKSIIREDAGSWQVQSATEKNNVYLVKRVGSSVCTCLLRCPLCAACTHSYKCTCLDYAVRNLVCCHIHAVNLAELAEYPATSFTCVGTL